MSKPTILFVEDDPAGREIGVFNLEGAGYQVDAFDSAEAAGEAFSPERHALVITDLRLPGQTGMELLGGVKQRAPEVPVLLITAYGDVDTAVEAMRAGADDFIAKPFGREQLLLRVERALAGAMLDREVRELRARAGGVERPIVGTSAAMREVLALVDRVAQSSATVLVSGETGTGKELIARRLHARSRRAEGPFVVMNCAAVPAELIEAELFGHEKGTFTGAHKARRGRFRQADGGTLLLDEIGEIPLALQGRLLRVLQEGMVDVLGADRPVGVDVRVVAATNRDLEAMVEAGTFRRDLLYRVNVVELELPPLRDRLDEVRELVEHFVHKHAAGRALVIGDALVEELKQRPWPGNVRELENACERIVALCDGEELSIEMLPRSRRSLVPPDVEEWPPLPEGGLGLVDLEKRVIERVLALKGGNVTHAARYLRVPRHILAYRMVKYGIRRDGT